MNSPKPLHTRLNTENDLNMSVDDHYEHTQEDSEHIEMNISVDEVNSHKIFTPSVKKTPKTSHTPKTPIRNNDRIIAEQLLISPDASKPLIMTEPKSKADDTDEGNKVSRHDHVSKLNATILSNLADTPNILETSAKSSVSSTGSASPRLVHKTFIEDSPAIAMNQSSKSKRLVITDSPEKSGSDEDNKSWNQSIKIDASMLADSVLEESMVEENEVHNTTKSFNRSSRDKNKNLEKSLHDLELDDNNALPDLDTNAGAKSFCDNDMLPDLKNLDKPQRSVIGDDHLPDLDSPVVARSVNKSKSFKKHVIESSDENSDVENYDDRNLHVDDDEIHEDKNFYSDENDEDDENQSDENVDHEDEDRHDLSDKQNNGSDEEMDHSGNDDDDVNGFIDKEAGADEVVEDEEEEYGEEEESDEEESGEEDDDGVPGKCVFLWCCI